MHEIVHLSDRITGCLFDRFAIQTTITLGEIKMAERTGSDKSETLFGTDVNDILKGLGGDDELYGLGGSDILDGGDGNDWLDAGRGGNEALYGGNGDDTMLGGGADYMQGGFGNDLYYVNNVNDAIVEEYGEGFDTVRSFISYSLELSGFVENLVLENGAANGTGNGLNNEIYGNAADNNLFGRDGNDVLRAGDGNDILWGENGDDHLAGESGNNQLFGGSGNDIYYIQNATTAVFEAAGGGRDGVRSIVSYTLTAEVEVLSLDGTAAINGTGNNLGNEVYGNTASNSIFGGGGDDHLVGLAGNDIITGGSGKDTFGFFTPWEGIDTIKDFKVVDDGFFITRSGFGAGLTAGYITTDQFRIGSSAQDSSDRFIYNKSTGAVFFDADGIGGAAQVQIAKVSTGLAMTNKNFFVGG
ncbi:MAG: calcium-binding protein [Cyanobacteria bacterium CRU_2_1]|nr:calcium-binding protein [Cyanobacteria bacterium CRU_2_1]